MFTSTRRGPDGETTTVKLNNNKNQHGGKEILRCFTYFENNNEDKVPVATPNHVSIYNVFRQEGIDVTILV